MSRFQNKDTRKLVKRLREQGFEVTETAGSHPLIRLDGRRVTTLASTPSDVRSRRNELAALRRAGFKPGDR